MNRVIIGQQDVLIMPYDPRKPYLSGEQYVHDPGYLSADVVARVAQDVLTLNRALGYDINTVEFAIKDGVPYAIDFMNPAPDFDINSLTPEYFAWVVQHMADLVIGLAKRKTTPRKFHWETLFKGRTRSRASSA